MSLEKNLGEGIHYAKRESSTPGKHICLPARLLTARDGCWNEALDLAAGSLKRRTSAIGKIGGCW